MIVIPMAGESSRFKKAGYSRPKYMLPISGRPLFDWTLLSFKKYFESEAFLFVALNSNGVEDFIKDRITQLGIRNSQIVILAASTSGQAETVEKGLSLAGVPADTSITIFNIDTIRPLVNLTTFSDKAGWLEVFNAPGENWSFVLPDPCIDGRVLSCTEKSRISDLCCTGLYNFSRVDLYLNAISKERKRPTMNELYVAPLYNHLLDAGLEVEWRWAPKSKVVLSGVPTEYEALLTRGLTETLFLA